MSVLGQVLIESARLAILRFLAEDNDYSLNTSILQECLTRIGLSLTRDNVETQAAWLAEQGLVEIERLGHVSVVKLSPRGYEASQGRATIPGVQRPKPGQ